MYSGFPSGHKTATPRTRHTPAPDGALGILLSVLAATSRAAVSFGVQWRSSRAAVATAVGAPARHSALNDGYDPVREMRWIAPACYRSFTPGQNPLGKENPPQITHRAVFSGGLGWHTCVDKGSATAAWRRWERPPHPYHSAQGWFHPGSSCVRWAWFGDRIMSSCAVTHVVLGSRGRS